MCFLSGIFKHVSLNLRSIICIYPTLLLGAILSQLYSSKQLYSFKIFLVEFPVKFQMSLHLTLAVPSNSYNLFTYFVGEIYFSDTEQQHVKPDITKQRPQREQVYSELITI